MSLGRVFKKSVILCRQKPNHKEKSDLQGREISAHWTGNHYDEQEIWCDKKEIENIEYIINKKHKKDLKNKLAFEH